MDTPQTVSIVNTVQQLTGGRPYVFLVRAFRQNWSLYRDIKAAVEDEVGLACIDAEEVPGAGEDLLAKVHLLVERAELVIADIGTTSANVFYEAGYAAALGKPMLLVSAEGASVPANLRGKLLITYTEDEAGMERLQKQVVREVEHAITSQVPLLRDMLEAPVPEPAYIVASPKYPSTRSKIKGQDRDEATFGDNLGILGLISAFGLIRGEDPGVELVSAHYAMKSLVEKDLSLYLIGSDKVNEHTGTMLRRLQNRREPKWMFDPPDARERTGDYPVVLYRTRDGKKSSMEARTETRGADKTNAVFVEDYGIVVRGPHPKYQENRLVLIMAGPHSLGTGAACLAATRSPLIQEIGRRLKEECDVNLADKDKTIWALVKGNLRRSRSGGALLDVKDVSVQEVGVYE